MTTFLYIVIAYLFGLFIGKFGHMTIPQIIEKFKK